MPHGAKKQTLQTGGGGDVTKVGTPADNQVGIWTGDGTLVVNGEAMTEIGGGWYVYTFTGYSPSTDYVYDCNPGATAYRESGVTDNTEQLISEIRAGGGGGYINIQGIQSTIRNTGEKVIEEVKAQHKDTQGVIQSSKIDLKSHIKIVIGDLTNSIESIPETDLSTINSSLGVVKTQLTKAISGKDKEKAEITREYEKRLKDKEKEIEELEETYKEMESSTKQQINEKVSEKEELIKELEETAQELMEEYEKENINAKELVIEKIKQSL